MLILAIDPGDRESGWIVYNTETKNIEQKGITENYQLLHKEVIRVCEFLAIEMIDSYGMPVGKSIFETCLWIGRYIEAWGGDNYVKIYRKDIRIYLCHSMMAKDCNIRQAIIDLYPPIGGGSIPQIGTKKKPGLLYGLKKDMWSALAIAITAAEQISAKEKIEALKGGE